MPFVTEDSPAVRLEAQIERAFGPLPVPPSETILGWMLDGKGEEEWTTWAFGGKRYDEVDPKALDAIFLTHTLSPSAFAYYVGSAALAAARAPTQKQDTLVNDFVFEDVPVETLPEDYAFLDLPRVQAIRAALAHVRAELVREERESWEGDDGFFDPWMEDSFVSRIAAAEKVVEGIERLLVGG